MRISYIYIKLASLTPASSKSKAADGNRQVARKTTENQPLTKSAFRALRSNHLLAFENTTPFWGLSN